MADAVRKLIKYVPSQNVLGVCFGEVWNSTSGLRTEDLRILAPVYQTGIVNLLLRDIQALHSGQFEQCFSG